MRLTYGQKYVGEAIEVKPYGAVLKLEDGSTHLLHISNISEDFVKDINDFIVVGNYYEVTAVPGSVKKVELTLKDVDVQEFEEAFDEDEDFDTMLERYLPRPDYRDRKIRRKYNKDKR